MLIADLSGLCINKGVTFISSESICCSAGHGSSIREGEKNMASTELQCDGTDQAFSNRVSEQLVGGIASIGIAMGMETGLFDVMIALGEKPHTSQEIADTAGMKERYVREWLGCMAAADIIKFNPTMESFWLPSNRSCIMELKASALTAPILYGGFFQVAECFKKDGPSGVAYNTYHKFDELMGLTQGPFFRDQLVQRFIPSMPELHQQLITGLEVLDTGCGEGISTFAMARHFPKSQFYGVDLSQSALTKAQEKAVEMGLSNTKFINADITQMPSDWTDKFDYLFMHFVLHDLSYPTKALQEMHRVLKPGGTLSVIESNAHSNLQDNLDMQDRENILIEYTYSLLNCMPTSLYPGVGAAGLGAMWGREKAKEALTQANFRVILVTEAYKEGVHLMCKKPLIG